METNQITDPKTVLDFMNPREISNYPDEELEKLFQQLKSWVENPMGKVKTAEQMFRISEGLTFLKNELIVRSGASGA